MKKIQYYIMAVFMCISIIACKKSEIETYHGQEVIYFNDLLSNSDSQRDSVILSFARMSDTAVDTTLNIPVAIMGKPVNRDRYFKVQVDQAASTAIAGKYYDALPEQILFKAGSVNGVLPIKIHRYPDMLKQIFSLSIQLVPNGDFQVNTASIASATTVIRRDRYKVLMTDILIKPDWWSSSVDSYFGTFSRKKVGVIETAAGYNLSQIEPYILKYDWAFVNAVARTTQVYLNYQNAIGNTIMDENGQVMSMGSIIK